MNAGPGSAFVVGRYAIYGKIASGGMATVHFGRLVGAAGFSRTVAIKRLHSHLAEDPQFLSTMIDEARLAARIHHPNVVPMLDVVAANGELLLVMEYVRGESLSRLVTAEGARLSRMPLAVASAIAIGALHGLHAAHEATNDRGVPLGIVHRDVSPQNILVGVDGVARVIDFGVAKAAGRLQTTSEGALKGKVAYMAPEQASSGDQRLAVGRVTRASDIYAMGVVLWEMLTGKRLFQGEGEAQVLYQVLEGAKDPPSRYAPRIPPALDTLVMKALALDPTARFESARQMAESLFRVAPPAFPTVVGEWVERVAKDALARRGAELADIESSSDAVIVSPESLKAISASESGRTSARVSDAPRPPVWGHETPTVASQPSSLSIETPPLRGEILRPRRTRRSAALGAVALLVVAGVTTFLLRGLGTSRRTAGAIGVDAAELGPDADAVLAATSAAPVPSSSPAPSVAAPELTITREPEPAPPPPVSAARAPSTPEPTAAASTAPPAPAAPPARPATVTRPRSKHQPARPPSPFRFAQPD